MDVECGHTYIANLEAVRTLSPSAKPNAEIDLPLAPALQRQVELRNLIDLASVKLA